MLSLGISSFFVSPPLSFVSAVNSCAFLHRAFFKKTLLLPWKKLYWTLLFGSLVVGHISVAFIMVFVRFPHSALFSNWHVSSLGTDIAEGTVSAVNGFIIVSIVQLLGSQHYRSPFRSDAIP